MGNRPPVTVGVVQCLLNGSAHENLEIVSIHTIDAATQGKAQIICLPELVEMPYPGFEQNEHRFAEARTVRKSPLVTRMREIAKQHTVVVIAPFFERDGHEFFNSAAVIDASGDVIGVYRKSHIPDGPGYQEKFLFQPGNTGFMVHDTRYARIGVGVCWDQWFPECARDMVLQGAEVLLYPTAIGSEPQFPEQDNREPWRRAMQGHAVCNHIPVAAANRVGTEVGQRFFGHSFICDPRGDLVASMTFEEGYVVASLDLDLYNDVKRPAWGFLRDRRPELYHRLVSNPPRK